MTTVSLDTVSQAKGSGAGGTTLSWSRTCSGSANELLIGLAHVKTNTGSPFATSVTYNGVACSSVSTVARVTSFQTTTCEVWSLPNPASGANTASATFANTVRSVGFGASFINASGSSALGAPASANNQTSVATVSGIQANGEFRLSRGVHRGRGRIEQRHTVGADALGLDNAGQRVGERTRWR